MSGKLKMYVANYCPFCQKAELTAREKKVKYERELIDVHGPVPDWYKKLNPSETVPTLVVDDNKIILESNLIAQYLDTLSSPAGSLCGGTNAIERQRIELFMSQVSEFVGAARAVLMDPTNPEKRAILDEKLQYVECLFAMKQVSGPYFLDDKFSYGDICILPFLHQFKHTLGYYAGYDVFRFAPNLKRMYAEAMKRESVKQTVLTAEQNIEASSYLVPDSSPLKGSKGGVVIFNSRYTPYGDRVKIAANVKGLKYHHVEVNLMDIPVWLKFYNPRETVPALMTPVGEGVHESNNIVQFIDQSQGSTGRVLLPRDNADAQFAVQYFITMTDNFIYGFTQMIATKGSDDAVAEIRWACGELEKLLKKKPFGEGPFLGGKQMNAGDIALLPMLVRVKAVHPALVKLDVLGEFPLLNALLQAGVAAPETKGVFLDDAEYLKALQFYASKM